MGGLRILLLAIFAAAIAGCAAHIPLRQAPEDVSTVIDEPDSPAKAEEPSEAEKSKLPEPKPATTSTTSRKTAANRSTPKVGSPEWKKERAENERKEQHLREVIEGICSGC
jgi:hypothetical protein